LGFLTNAASNIWFSNLRSRVKNYVLQGQPQFHIVTLLTQLDNALEREWYAAQTAQHGWSRTTLALHIKNRLQQRQGGAVTNFQARLPAAESALARETLKDPYLSDFLGLGEEAHEREIENGLTSHISSTSTWPLLMHNSRRQMTSRPSACCCASSITGWWPNMRSSSIDKPIGVAEYQLLRDLPATLEKTLPSIADIEAELSNDVGALHVLDEPDTSNKPNDPS
jgi:hypothetical protein